MNPDDDERARAASDAHSRDGSDPEEKFFGTKLDDPGEPALPATPYRTAARNRQALRRLQDAPPTPFEEVIDLIYLWKVHAPDMQLTDMMRKLVQTNHNMSDLNAIAAMKSLIREARMAKVTQAIAQMGLDEAESVLGLKKDL
jgi:hypothetical protein